MEYRQLIISCSVIVSFILVGECHNRVSLPDEDYWQVIWPKTPIPNVLLELLKPSPADTEVNDLSKKLDDIQFPKNFFFQEDLYPGKTMKVQFSKGQTFGFSVWDKDAKDIEKQRYTINDACIKKSAAKGERKFCAKSLGTLIDYAISRLGGKNIEALSSSFVGNKEQQYTLEGIQNLGDKAVMCHRLYFQNTVFYCHEIHATTAFKVSLVAGDGTKTHALAVCHFDTSGMNHDVVDHQILKVDPGSKPICHFLGNKAVLWVPNSAVDNAYNSNLAI